jgi:site-specific DNA-cytosine methylase
MDAVELFSGIGISALGVVRSGHRLVAALDCESKLTSAFNSQTILPKVAVTGFVGSTVTYLADLVCAGPVCKAFSPGATLFGTEGSEDDRNTFPYLLQHLRVHPAKYVLIENSYGMQRFKGYVEELIKELGTLGYKVDFGEIDCYDFGVPQHRRRVVFLCSKDKPWKLKVPTRRPAGPATVGECMRLPAPDSDPWPLVKPLSEKALDYFTRDPRHAKKHPPLKMDQPASTVVSVYRKGVPYGVVEYDGKLQHCMPRLAARLQGIPEEYDLSMLSKTAALEAIGNGFPGQVVTHLLNRL